MTTPAPSMVGKSPGSIGPTPGTFGHVASKASPTYTPERHKETLGPHPDEFETEEEFEEDHS